MYQTTVQIDGMMCGMCESHVNDAFRAKLAIQKVQASHKKGEAVILSEQALSEDAVAAALEGTGYRVLRTECVPYEKKGFFSRFKK